MDSTKQTNTRPTLVLLTPPPPKFLLRPTCPPPIGHCLAPILRPRYLEIVNRQLALDIKEAEWKSTLEHLFIDDKTEVPVKKQVSWAEKVQIYEADYPKTDEEDDIYGEDYHADNEAEGSNKKTPQNDPHNIVSKEVEDDFPLPFPTFIVPAGAENDFSPPFPKQISLQKPQ